MTDDDPVNNAAVPRDTIRPPALYSVPNAAQLLGNMSERRVWQLLAEGELRRVTIGHRTFVRGDDLLALIDRHTTNGDGNE